jgi:glyoxylase-like metal-dependent hydrolase (beta-lactamase superfamily II)
MKIKILSVGPFEVNCAIVWNDAKQALVIDPGSDADRIEAVLQENGLTVASYLLTHGHADHLNALADLYETRPAPVYIHAEDLTWCFGPQNQIPPYYPVPEKPAAEFIHPEKLAPHDPPRPSGTPPAEGILHDPPRPSGTPPAEGILHNPPRPSGTPPAEGILKVPLHGRGGRSGATDGAGPITLADLSFQTLETPGHTRGGVCYYFEKEKVIFTGDTLFKGTCGRTDLPGGDGRILAASLKKLAALPDDVTVYPGHNESTTIGHEKRTNFFMQQVGR